MNILEQLNKKLKHKVLVDINTREEVLIVTALKSGYVLAIKENNFTISISLKSKRWCLK